MSATAVTLATKLPSAGALVLAALAAAVVIGALVVLMRRQQDALPMLAVFALPFRVPISTGGRTVNLLVPLYLVARGGHLGASCCRPCSRPAGRGVGGPAGRGASSPSGARPPG